MTEESKILEALRNDPAVIAALDRQKAEKAEHRREAGVLLKAAIQEAAESLPALTAAVVDAERAVIEHDAARKPLIEALRKASAAYWQKKLSFDQRKRNAERDLMETAPPETDEAIEYFENLFWELRKRTPGTQTHRTGFDLLGMKRQFKTFTSAPSLEAAMLFCQEAKRELLAAKTDPDFSLERIDELKRNIPDATALVEFEAERGVKDAADVKETDLLPSDSYLDWTKATLEEKFEKWKRGKL